MSDTPHASDLVRLTTRVRQRLETLKLACNTQSTTSWRGFLVFRLLVGTGHLRTHLTHRKGHTTTSQRLLNTATLFLEERPGLLSSLENCLRRDRLSYSAIDISNGSLCCWACYQRGFVASPLQELRYTQEVLRSVLAEAANIWGSHSTVQLRAHLSVLALERDGHGQAS